MTTEEKFTAAVNVIKSLPKNGSYQPSHDLMLRFYAYYKQATLGPCTGGRPAFWDVVARAKYDAWKNLGDMSKTDAMQRYVDELHSIVETMSYSDKVASFLNAPTGSPNIADLELIAGDVIQKVRSRSNSPKDSRNPSPTEMNGHADSWNESPFPSESDTDHSDGDYVDTIEAPEPRKPIPNGHHIPLSNGYPPNKDHVRPKRQRVSSVDISQEVAKAVQGLKSDIEALKGKMAAIEVTQSTAMVAKKKSWWQEISPQLLTFMIVWPFVASLIINRFLVKKST